MIKKFFYKYLKSRIAVWNRFGYYQGFKVQCLGRFSRKQRASSYWFSKGRVPLNTITSSIQYAFFSIPLVNSAISVKVWLHVTKNDSKYLNYKIII